MRLHNHKRHKTQISRNTYEANSTWWYSLNVIISMIIYEVAADSIKTLHPRQNGHHFADNIFNFISLYLICCILMQISRKNAQRSPVNNKPALVHIMAWPPNRQQVTIWTNNGLLYWCIYASLIFDVLKTLAAVMGCQVIRPTLTWLSNYHSFYLCHLMMVEGEFTITCFAWGKLPKLQ